MISHLSIARALFASLLVLGVLTHTSYAQTAEDALRMSERDPAVGPRMIGLSGAGTLAGVSDFSSLFANPAGLGYFNSSSLSGSLAAISTSDDMRFVTPNFSESSSHDLRNTALGHVAYIHRIPTAQGSLVLGGSLHRSASFDRSMFFGGDNHTTSVTDLFMPFLNEFEVREDDEGYYPHFFRDLSALAYEAGAIEFLFENVDSEGPLFDQAVLPGTRIEQQGDVLEEGGMNELSIGGAFEAAPNVMVGLSANLLFGTYRFTSFFNEFDAFGENADYIVRLEGGDLVGFDELEYEQGFESDISGVNLRGGVSGQLAPGVRAGFSVETPTFKNVTESYWENLTTFFVEGGSLSSSREGTFDYSITTPWKLGGGVAYEGDGLLVGLDAEYVDWSQMKFDSDVDEAYFEDVNRSIRDAFDPVINTRIGAEYWVGDLALRGGFAYQPDPRKEDISFSDGRTDRSKTQFSAGIGYRFNQQFTLDLAWAQQRFDDAYRPYSFENGPIVEESVVRNRFVVGFSARF